MSQLNNTMEYHVNDLDEKLIHDVNEYIPQILWKSQMHLLDNCCNSIFTRIRSAKIIIIMSQRQCLLDKIHC